MWELIPAKERKLYRILERLYFSESSLSLMELTEAVGSSRRTVSDYIDELKTRVDTIGGSLNTLAEGYMLVLPDNISIVSFQQDALKASPSLQLLEKLLVKNEMTGVELEKELHISASTLSRMVTALKNKLAGYGLILEANPYRITGDEFLIRRFFTSYYLEAYDYDEWPLPFIDYREIEKLIDSLAHIDTIRFETVNVQKFILFTAVSIVRERFHHDLRESDLTEGRYEPDGFKRMRQLVNTWLTTVDITPDKKDLYSRIYTFYMFYYFRSYTTKKVLLDSPDHSKTIVHELQKIAQTFDLPQSDFSHIACKLDDMLYQYSNTSYAKSLDTYLVFTPADYPVLRVYKKQYPYFYDALKQLLYTLYALHDIDPEQINTDELLYLIISRWDRLSLHLYESYTRCDVLVYSPNSYRHADNVAQLLRAKLERACRVSVYAEPILNKQRLNDYTFDILVSAGSLDLDIDQPIIALHSKMSGRHLQPLLKKVDEAFEKNRKKLREHRKI